jgi:hypothetical protein
MSDGSGSPGQAGDGGSIEASVSWCATHAAAAGFCADFDERGLEQFDEQTLDNGTLGVDTLVSRSAPGSLWVAAGPRRAGVATFVEKHTPGSVTRATVAFDLFVEAVHSEGAAEIVHLKFDANDSHYTVGVGISGGTRLAYAYEYSPRPDIYRDVVESNAIPLATWVRITLSADLSARTVTLERDDEVGAARTPIAAPFSGPLELELGLAHASTGEAGWKVRVDNVVLDWE